MSNFQDSLKRSVLENLNNSGLSKEAFWPLAAAVLRNTGSYFGRAYGSLAKGVGKFLTSSGQAGAGRAAATNAERLAFNKSTGAASPGMLGTTAPGMFGKVNKVEPVRPLADMKRTRMGNWLHDKGTAWSQWGDKQRELAMTYGNSIGGTKGQFARGLIKATPYVGYGATPVGYALNKGLDQLSPETSWAANQRRQGAGQALASFNQMPAMQRLGMAFSPEAAANKLRQTDPRTYEYYQKYML